MNVLSKSSKSKPVLEDLALGSNNDRKPDGGPALPFVLDLTVLKKGNFIPENGVKDLFVGLVVGKSEGNSKGRTKPVTFSCERFGNKDLGTLFFELLVNRLRFKNCGNVGRRKDCQTFVDWTEIVVELSVDSWGLPAVDALLTFSFKSGFVKLVVALSLNCEVAGSDGGNILSISEALGNSAPDVMLSCLAVAIKSLLLSSSVEFSGFTDTVSLLLPAE